MSDAIEINNIYCIDCLEGLKRLPNESIDLVITSPPYNLRNCIGGFFKQKEVKHIWRDAKLRQGYDNYNDNMPYDKYVIWQREVLTECMRVLKDNGAIFYNHKFRIQKGKLITRMEIINGFPLRQIIIWNKRQAINFNWSHIPPAYEVIFMICKKNFRFNKKGGWTDVWDIPADKKNNHPAPFPLEIPKRIIEKTNANVILDPFMGSGTTALACRMLNRNYIGFEQSQKYVNECNDRLEEYNKQNRLFRELISKTEDKKDFLQLKERVGEQK